METGCLICGAPLVYLKEAEPMECMICHKKKKARPDVFRGTTSAMLVILRGWIPS